MKRTRLVSSVAAGVVMLLAACGSTVPVSRQAAQAPTDELSGGTGATPGSAAAGASGGATGTATRGGARASATRPGGVGPVRRGTTAGSTVRNGVNASAILVGYGTEKDASTAAKTFGLNAAFGDQEAQVKAVVDDINKRGGVLGRKLQLVLHDTASATALQDPNGAAQAQCDDWTEDHKVFAAVNIVGGLNNEVLFGCMVKHQTPLVMSDLTSHSIADLAQYAPYLFAAGVATIDRYVPVWIDRLVADKYFMPWDTTAGGPGSAAVKIGVPYVDTSVGRQYLKLVQQNLARHSLSVGDSFAFSPDTSQALGQIPSTLLRFRSEGVTHILLPEDAYVVTPVAEQQHYRPRYAVTTFDALASLTTTTSPPGQLTGSLGMGWLPISDVDNAHDPGPVSPAQTHCLDVMNAAGQGSTDRLTETTALIVCDAFNFIVAALASGGDATPDAFRRGVATLGAGFPSAMTFEERYGPNRFDGAAAGRDVAYQAGCNCYAYTDKTDRPFGT